MKLSIRKVILASSLALTAAIATIPAHATLSGSDPRPNFSSQSTYLYAAMAVLGY